LLTHTHTGFYFCEAPPLLFFDGDGVTVVEQGGVYEVVGDWTATKDSQLTVQSGERLVVEHPAPEKDWWIATTSDGRRGKVGRA
jgi:hypothetical protein